MITSKERQKNVWIKNEMIDSVITEICWQTGIPVKSLKAGSSSASFFSEKIVPSGYDKDGS